MGFLKAGIDVEELLKYYLTKNRLRFNAELEKEFAGDYFQRILPITRIALVMAFILYAAFGVLDVFVSPETKNFTWFIRYVVVCPFIIAVFMVSYFKIFKKIIQISLSLVSLVAGFGIIAMIVTAKSVEGSLYYYAGLSLVIIWSYTFVRLKFIHATIVCWIIVFTYELAIIIFKDVLSSNQLTNAFISNNFFFISFNVIGMFVCFHMEMYTRKDFLQRLLINKHQAKIEEENIILAEWRKIMDDELMMAKDIQRQIIPGNNPSKYISALFKPMEPIGGDFYDFIKFRNTDKTGIFISDVSGHGVPAALITAMIKSLISSAGNYKLNPSRMFMYLNDILVKQSGESYVTAFYGIYDRRSGTITYSCAGHNPPYVIDNMNITELNEARSFPLGVMTNDDLYKMNKNYINHKQSLPSGSKLLLYTDGLTEASSALEKYIFFDSVIFDILPRLASLSCEDFIASLYSELVTFSGSEDFDDDVCIICIDVE